MEPLPGRTCSAAVAAEPTRACECIGAPVTHALPCGTLTHMGMHSPFPSTRSRRLGYHLRCMSRLLQLSREKQEALE